MRLDQIASDSIAITLSRRNLLTLLHKLERPESERTIFKMTEDGRILSVQAEHDDAHYNGRPEGPPERMHPLEEDALAADWYPEDA